MNLTAKLRKVFVCVYVLVVVAAVVGWFLDKDPARLAPVIGWVVAAVGFGEASNVGKRATFKENA